MKSCYIILRQNNSLTFIACVPYSAKKHDREFLLENRTNCARQLGGEHFARSLICKEVGEITDARSWEERDAETRLHVHQANVSEECDTHGHSENAKGGIQDVGYMKNKCRLCDRRMKNKISDQASDALTKLHIPGTAVQIVPLSSFDTSYAGTNLLQSVNISTETLMLNYIKHTMSPKDIAATLPSDNPSFTFYCHPTTRLLYFVFHSSDSASIQEHMKHTMAIPGLINVHVQDQGVYVDQKIEIHDPEDLVFEAKDRRMGKFRSVYLRYRFDGTESTYESLEADKAFYDAVE
jgi:twinfilin-like protein